ncbi:MAG: hypothetical protein HOK54_13125 [Alphaproteobacteria bacterium]|jgi:hypothetical protein|nr:hypothetical protein [Alphaproteobacteria bacterium]
MSLGKFTARAAGAAADAVGEVLGSETYPESEYGLAALLFQHIVQSERGTEARSRAYYRQLMSECLVTVRQK